MWTYVDAVGVSGIGPKDDRAAYGRRLHLFVITSNLSEAINTHNDGGLLVKLGPIRGQLGAN